jgi:Phosphodiester glycosidase
LVKHLSILAVLLLVTSSAATGQRRTSALVWPDVERLQPVLEGHIVAVTVVRAPLRDFRLAVAVPEPNEQGDSLAGFREHFAAVAVLSGGFLASFYPPIPIGLVKVKGTVVNRFFKPDDVITGMLALADGRPVIQPAADFSHERWEECLQSGPVIVAGGRTTVPTSPQTKAAKYLVEALASRAVVARTGSDVLLIHADPVRLKSLADFVARSKSDGGLGAIDALNLSGASTAGLVVTTARGDVSAGNRDSRLANALVIQRRSPTSQRR